MSVKIIKQWNERVPVIVYQRWKITEFIECEDDEVSYERKEENA